jgi:general secretion pathway protein G
MRQVRKAFTLVELLVVIGIIALLIAILMPALSKAKGQAQWAACMSNMRQLGQALLMYANENKQNLPRPASNGNGQFPDDFIIWRDAADTQSPYPAPNKTDDTVLAKYLNAQGDKLKTIFRCPTDVYDDRGAQAGLTNGPYRFSFTMNKAWDPDVNSTVAALTRPRPRLTQVKNAAEKLLLAEEKQPNDGRFEFKNQGTGGADELCDRHAKQGNILWHDFHVDRRYWKELHDSAYGVNGSTLLPNSLFDPFNGLFPKNVN